MPRPAPKGPTAGPWAASSEPDSIGKRYVIHSIPTATGVAFCFTKGDAYLIAAAPRLLKAVRLLTEWIGPPRQDRDSFDSLREDGWREAQAALAQVDGKD